MAYLPILKCSSPNCSRDIKDTSGKCILHRDKNNWYIENNGVKDWSEKQSEITEFWTTLNEYIEVQSDNVVFDHIIFPEFLDSFIEVVGTKRLKKNINFVDCKFLSLFELSNVKLDGKLLFQNCEFFDDIKLENCLVDDEICFTGETLVNQINVTGKTKVKGLYFKKIYSETDLVINVVEFDKNLKNLKAIIEKCNIEECTINTIKIFVEYRALEITTESDLMNKRNDEIIIGELIIASCRFNILDFNNIYIGKLLINNYSKCIDFIQLEESAIQKLIFENVDIFNCNSLFLKELDIEELTIKRMLGSAKFNTLSDIKIKKIIIFENSNLSNFEFHDSDFLVANKTFNNISFISNKGNTIFNGVNWGDITKTFDPLTDRDTFRQLKYVNEQQGNFIEANMFYSAEMKAYKEELKDEQNKFRWQDRIIFLLNEKVSNFSQSWILPLAWYFVFGSLLAFIYYFNSRIFFFQGFISTTILLVSIVMFCNVYKELSDLKKILKLLTIISGLNYFMNVPSESFTKLFKFINPFNTSGLDDIDGRLIWWILFRMISVFIIYQFIVSLRRQTRR